MSTTTLNEFNLLTCLSLYEPLVGDKTVASTVRACLCWFELRDSSRCSWCVSATKALSSERYSTSPSSALSCVRRGGRSRSPIFLTVFVLLGFEHSSSTRSSTYLCMCVCFEYSESFNTQPYNTHIMIIRKRRTRKCYYIRQRVIVKSFRVSVVYRLNDFKMLAPKLMKDRSSRVSWRDLIYFVGAGIE
jgi:hypothetical protein